MKKTSLVLFLVMLFFGSLTYYFKYHADGGADGLSTFTPLVFVGVLFVCSLLALLVSFFLNKGQPSRTQNRIIGTAVALPVLGLISVIGVFNYWTIDYGSQHSEQVELNKTVLKDVRFKSEEFGVAFQHVSGRVSEYQGKKPIPTSITPKIENEILFVPIDDESYHSPNMLVKIDIDPTQELSLFFEDLKSKLQLEDHQFNKASTTAFTKLGSDVQIWEINLVDISSNDMTKLLEYFSPGQEDFPEVIYFIKPSKTTNQLLVLLVSNTILSAPASVEKMSASNFDEGNLWFHTLELAN